MCLKAISELGPGRATVATVSSRVELSPATVSRIMDRLTKARLVRRVPNASDRRKVGLVLTPAGRSRYEALPPPLETGFIERLMAMDAGSRESLLSSLAKLTQLMEPEGGDRKKAV